MERLNLTLDNMTSDALARYAQREGKPRAALARELICEAIARREAAAQRRRLAHDYAAGRGDAKALLEDLDAPQLDLLGDEED
jgi:hypothetical protein